MSGLFANTTYTSCAQGLLWDFNLMDGKLPAKFTSSKILADIRLPLQKSIRGWKLHKKSLVNNYSPYVTTCT